MPRRMAALLVALVLLVSLMPMAALADAAAVRTVRVGFFAFEGYHEIGTDGTKSGYGYDFLTLMKRYANVRYEYVGYDCSWDDMQRMLLDGEIDMVTSAHKTAEREALFDFSAPIGTNSVQLNTRADNERFIAGQYDTYNGMTIGLVTGSSVNEKVAVFA